MKTYSSQAPIEFSGYTLQHDELIEWRDDEACQHGVQVNREWRGLPDITFTFGMQSEAHALFLALCQAENIMVDGEELPDEHRQARIDRLVKHYNQVGNSTSTGFCQRERMGVEQELKALGLKMQRNAEKQTYEAVAL